QQLLAAEPAEPAASAATAARDAGLPAAAVVPSAARRLPIVVALIAVIAVAAGGIVLVGRHPTAAPPLSTTNADALREFQRARFGDNAGRVQIQSGIHHYREAVRLDPNFAEAWAGLATAHVALTWFGDEPASDTMAQARREAQQAMQLNPARSGPWRVLAFISHYVDWDHAEAERQFRKAL